MNKITGPLLIVLITTVSSLVHADNESYASISTGTIETYNGEAFIDNSLNSIVDDKLYEIQPETSQLKFRVESPIGVVWGQFSDFSGSFTMQESGAYNDPSSMVINTQSLNVDNGLAEVLLKSEDFFDIDNFPSMHFVGNTFNWYSMNKAVLKGYMTIKNVTQEVAFYIELVAADIDRDNSNILTLKAYTTIKRSAFGLESLASSVSDKVNLYLTVDAVKESPMLSMK